MKTWFDKVHTLCRCFHLQSEQSRGKGLAQRSNSSNLAEVGLKPASF